MDGRMVGLAGAIAGGVIGLMGGLIGTYCSVKNAEGPRERAFVIRFAILGSVGIAVFLVTLFALPMPWRFVPWIFYGPALMLSIRWGNATHARIRAEEHPEATPAALP